MGLAYFKDQLKKKHWVRGSIWELDWYLDVFFAEIAAFGNYPFYLGYEQAVLGDEYLDPTGWKNVVADHLNFFSNSSAVKKLIINQNTILNRADSLIKGMKKGKFELKEYKKIQLWLSQLMSSVTVLFDPLINSEIEKVSLKDGVNKDSLFGYVVDQSSHTALGNSNQQLLSLYHRSQDVFESAGFELDKLPSNVRRAMEQHSKRFGWINTGEKGSDEWTAKEFLSQLKPLINIPAKQITAERRIDIKDRSSKELLSSIIQININDNDAADKQVELDFLFQKFLAANLKERYVEKILENLTFEEILQVLDNPGLVNSRFYSRVNNWRAVWQENDGLEFHYFSDQKDFDNVVRLVPTGVSSNKISGSVACKGFVEGKARVIRTQKDLEMFVKGEVLIAEKTQPKYVPYMVKAAAIVTDIGGITSHAAIISREFEIPCIVGTENATKILKTGDMVVVDANVGVVTKK